MARQRNVSAPPTEVFLSHSHHDKRFMLRVADELRRHGVRTWHSDHNIIGAQQWLDEIGKALERCDWFIVILTPAAVESRWVKHELMAALNDVKYDERIVPLLVRQCSYRVLAWPVGNLQMVPFKPRKFTEGMRELLRIWNLDYLD
jgi:hypothetical protein